MYNRDKDALYLLAMIMGVVFFLAAMLWFLYQLLGDSNANKAFG
jgi:hypothetical protein